MSGPTRRSVPLADLSKAKLATIVNAQADLIEQLTRQLRSTSQTLIAVVLEPDAFHPQTNGIAAVDSSALLRVKPGHALGIEHRDGVTTLRVTEPANALVIERPRIVIPPGEL